MYILAFVMGMSIIKMREALITFSEVSESRSVRPTLRPHGLSPWSSPGPEYWRLSLITL